MQKTGVNKMRKKGANGKTRTKTKSLFATAQRCCALIAAHQRANSWLKSHE